MYLLYSYHYTAFLLIRLITVKKAAKPKTQIYLNNKTTPQLQGGKNGVWSRWKLNDHTRVYFSLKQRACPGSISLLMPGASKAILFSAWVQVVWLSRREGVNTAALCQASCLKWQLKASLALFQLVRKRNVDVETASFITGSSGIFMQVVS